MLPRLPNDLARRVWLHRSGLGDAPAGKATGADLLALIERLGFVQVDSINTVERAHHMILWSRRPAYRPANLKPLLERDRTLFEHWTHDASVIPTAFLPHWQLRFTRRAERLRERYRNWQGPEFEQRLEGVLAHIRDHGPVGSGEVGLDEARGKGGWWDWHPSKAALEFLWHTGQVAVTRRDGFAKIYDLAERVYPPLPEVPPEETIDWACRTAMARLGFATSGEVAAFWDKVTPDEAKSWCAAQMSEGRLEQIEVEGADGSLRRSFAPPGLLAEAPDLPPAPARIRVLSPFDPALRDRARAERLFGFHYRIEVFVPEARRRYGYYVFPVLEAERLIGRIDMKTLRQEDVLSVTAFWPEPGLRMGRGRMAQLSAELDRLARFSGVGKVRLADNWLRETPQSVTDL